MTLEFAIESVTGPRTENQDRANRFDSPFGSVFVVADGMGGYEGGALASSLVQSTVQDTLRRLPESESPKIALVEAIRAANRRVFEQSHNRDAALRHMGSTIVALLISETEDGLLAIGAHVGDSRLYFLREGRLFLLTQDHTVVQQLLNNQALTPAEAADHPQSNVLTRALGQKEDVLVDLTDWMLLRPGDTFLLCSDGLSGFANDQAIQEFLSDDDACTEIAARLVKLAYRSGSTDNVSVLIVRAPMNDQIPICSSNGSTTTNMN